MEKRLINLYVPAAQEQFDVLVPPHLDIAALIRLLAEGAAEICAGRYVPSHQEMLSLREPDLLLHPDKTLADYGIEDGARMVLI